MTVGPWKPIKLHTYDAYLVDIDIRSVVSEALDVNISVDLSLSDNVSSSGSITLKNPEGDVVFTEKNIKVEFGNAHAEFRFPSGELQLWYPVQYGKQPLYSIVVAVCDTVSIDIQVAEIINLYAPQTGQIIDSKTERVAFRRVRVVEEPLVDQPGKTFLFEVNNIRVFCGGSNWIPADSFLTTSAILRQFIVWLIWVGL